MGELYACLALIVFGLGGGALLISAIWLDELRARVKRKPTDLPEEPTYGPFR